MSKEYVNKIRYASYCTIYSARGTINNDLTSRVCFADILNRGKIKEEHYEIYILNDLDHCLNQCISNYCFLSIEEIRNHIRLARRLFPFVYDVEETGYNGHSGFKVTIDLDANSIYHRYLLTWIRYLYEFPFNIILNDALHMKQTYLNRVSIPNLFVLCANSYQNGPDIYNCGHAISYGSSRQSTLLKEYQLKQALSSLAVRDDIYGYLNQIYPESNIISYPKINTKSKGSYLEYWSDLGEFEERAKVYLKGYNLLTQ